MGRVAPTRDATILAAPENSLCQWQSALGDRDHAVARTMQKRERDDSGSTERTRNAAPIGCSAEASRVEEIGWNERNNRNSTMRAPTWAWPTSDAAAIAALEDAPAACSNPGKCAAIAPCTNQERRKRKPGLASPRATAGPPLFRWWPAVALLAHHGAGSPAS